MRFYHFCLSMSLAALTTARGNAQQTETDNWGPVTNQLRMSVHVAENHRQLGTNEPIKPLIRVENLTTNKTFHFYQPGAVEMSSAFSFHVISPSGKDMSPKISEPLHTSGQFVDIVPSQTKKIEFNLSEICKFGEVGNYRIQASCLLGHWTDREGRTSENVQLNSNTLDVSIKADQ